MSQWFPKGSPPQSGRNPHVSAALFEAWHVMHALPQGTWNTGNTVRVTAAGCMKMLIECWSGRKTCRCCTAAAYPSKALKVEKTKQLHFCPTRQRKACVWRTTEVTWPEKNVLIVLLFLRGDVQREFMMDQSPGCRRESLILIALCSLKFIWIFLLCISNEELRWHF